MSIAVFNDPWMQLFHRLLHSQQTAPRGLRTKEIMPYHMTLREPERDRWCTFPSRKLNISYAAFEFLWYLRADPEDDAITQRAKIWRELAAGGILQSNYGVYMFREGQFWRARDELRADKFSRRATIMILRPDHFETNSSDIPCTLGLSFYIRETKNMAGSFDKLHLHVTMRSSDAVFGMGNDIPCFTWTQEMMCAALQPYYPSLSVGDYHHTSHSMHVYERHFEMVEKIVVGREQRLHVPEPRISGPDEVDYVLRNAYDVTYRPDYIPVTYNWAKWLHEQAMEEGRDGDTHTR